MIRCFSVIRMSSVVEYEGVTLINPGSLSFGMNGAGYAIVEIEGKHIHAEMKTLPNL